MKKLVSLLLTVLLLSTLSTGYAIKEPIAFQGEFPFSEEPINLDVFSMRGVYSRGDFNELKCWEWLKEKTNIGLNFEAYTDDVIEEKLALKLASPELPDLFFKCGMDNAAVLKYAKEGVFIPITPYLEEYAPHFYYQIQNDPSLRAFLTMADGEIYGFNYIVSAANFMTPPVFVNGKWLKELGYDEVPADLNELKELLIKVRDTDLNGNGEKDEVPLTSTSLEMLYRLFAGAFGINTRGRSSLYFDVDEAGELRYIPTSEGYKNLLKYFKDLYSEGLIYKEIFDSSIANMTAVGEQNRIFLGKGSMHYVGSTYKDDFVGVTTIFKGPEGHQFNADVGNPILNMNTFITSENKYPKETVQLIDYFYSTEGVELMFGGFEGITFERNEEGNPVYNDYVQNNPDGLINEEVLGSYIPWGGGANPSMAEDRVFGENMYSDIEKAVCKERIKSGPEIVWGQFNFDEDQYRKLSVLDTDITAYVTEMRAKFITGELDIDAEWDNYVSVLKRMGLDEYYDIYQAGLEVYNKAAGL